MTQAVEHSEKTLTTSDGTELYVQTWTPSNAPPRAHVVILHGYLEHCGRYREVGEFLANNKNISVTAFDLRGHGKSSGQRGYIQSWMDYHQDVSTVLLDSMSTTSLPCFVLGHSNGGLLALDYFQTHTTDSLNVKGVIVTSPFLKAADDLGAVRMFLSKVLGCLMPKLSLAADVKSSDLTRDTKIAKANEEDSLVLKKFTLGWASQGMEAQSRVLSCTDFSLPLLFVYAGDDKISNPNTNREYAASIKQDDETVILREQDYHEVLNEIDRHELYETISEWILDRA